MKDSDLINKIEKAQKEGKIDIIATMMKVLRTHKAEKFIEETAKNMSEENKRKFKNTLVDFQLFLDNQ